MTRGVTRAASLAVRLLDILRRELRISDGDAGEILRAALGDADRLQVEVRDLSDELVEVVAYGFADVDTTNVCRADGPWLRCYDGRAAAVMTWQEAVGVALRIIAVAARMAHERCVAGCMLTRCRDREDETCAERCERECARPRGRKKPGRVAA